MADSNLELGLKVHAVLKEAGIETPMLPEHISYTTVEHPEIANYRNLGLDSLKQGFTGIVKTIGLDLKDDSIQDTPKRLAKMYQNEICWGLDYSKFPSCTTVDNKFGYDELVIVRDIEVKSLCEHHFMPIMGKATIAYIPGAGSFKAVEDSTQPDNIRFERETYGKVLGLSKFNRIVEFFARRPQVQERLTEQIAATLKFILETDDVAVIIAADHYCVKFRGIEDICSDTVTSKMSGRFREKPELRAELLALIGHSK